MTASSPDARAEYLARVKAQLVAQRGGASEPPPAPSRIAAPTLTLSGHPIVHRDAQPEKRQPSPYSESECPLVELVELARALPPSDLEVLALVARRLARTEGRAR